MQALYRSHQTKPIDEAAAAYLQIDSYQLMQRAAQAVYRHIGEAYSLLVVTGPGNNGGDGWVIAELARRDHKNVVVWALQNPENLTGDAAKAAADYQGEVIFSAPCEDKSFDLLVDAIFGTGLMRAPGGIYQDAIDFINDHPARVLAVDIPSGLAGDTGLAYAPAVRANITVAILNMMPGHVTADGQDYCGELKLDRLAVPDTAYRAIDPAAYVLNHALLNPLKKSRKHNSHKGSYGRLLVAGGQHGMLGAVLLSGTAALVSGAGLVQLITTEEQAPWVPVHRPELMALGFSGSEQQLHIPKADVLVMGMGLGTSQWSKALWQQLLEAGMPTVLDADGLNLLAGSQTAPDSVKVITPHPKEAARLLKCAVDDIQADRLGACQKLAEKYNCVVVLKGSGTVISDGEETFICPFGSADLATAGTGDVLSGMTGSLLAQGLTAIQSAQMAVVWHALTADECALGRCLTASDLIHCLPQTLIQS